MGKAHRRYGLERRRTKAEALRLAREARTTREQQDLLDARLGPSTGAVRERQRLLYQLATRFNQKASEEMRDFALMGKKRKR